MQETPRRHEKLIFQRSCLPLENAVALSDPIIVVRAKRVRLVLPGAVHAEGPDISQVAMAISWIKLVISIPERDLRVVAHRCTESGVLEMIVDVFGILAARWVVSIGSLLANSRSHFHQLPEMYRLFDGAELYVLDKDTDGSAKPISSPLDSSTTSAPLETGTSRLANVTKPSAPSTSLSLVKTPVTAWVGQEPPRRAALGVQTLHDRVYIIKTRSMLCLSTAVGLIQVTAPIVPDKGPLDIVSSKKVLLRPGMKYDVASQSKKLITYNGTTSPRNAADEDIPALGAPAWDEPCSPVEATIPSRIDDHPTGTLTASFIAKEVLEDAPVIPRAPVVTTQREPPAPELDSPDPSPRTENRPNFPRLAGVRNIFSSPEPDSDTTSEEETVSPWVVRKKADNMWDADD